MPSFYGTPRRRRDEKAVHAGLLSHTSMLEQRQDTQARWTMHDQDERLWRLEKYVLEEVATNKLASPEDWPAVTLNGPRTLWQAVRKAVTSKEPRFRIQLPGVELEPPPPDADPWTVQSFEQALSETTKHENFVTGLFQTIDEHRRRRDLQALQLDLAFFIAIRGGAVSRVWFDPDRPWPFSVQLWDPRTVVYEPGYDGLSFACHHYREPLYSARDRFPDTKVELAADEDGNVEVYDGWWVENDRCYNCVWTTQGVLREAIEMPKLDHLPIYVTRMSGPDAEAIYNRHGDTKATIDAWESIYAANRDTYPWLNRIASLFGIYLRNAAIGPWVVNGWPGSADALKRELRPFGLIGGQGASQITVTPVGVPQMAAEVKELFAFMQGQEQRGGVPYSMFGQVPFQLSGFAVNQLQGAVGIIAEPLAKSMEWQYRLIADECVQQFKARGKSLTLRGRDIRRQQFIEEITRAEIREKYYLEVDLTPELPNDRLQEAQVAQGWASVGVDPVTILDEVLGIPDPRQVIKRMAAWQLFQQQMQQQAAMMAKQAQMRPDGRVFPSNFQDPTAGMGDGDVGNRHVTMNDGGGMGNGGGGVGY